MMSRKVKKKNNQKFKINLIDFRFQSFNQRKNVLKISSVIIFSLKNKTIEGNSYSLHSSIVE